MDEPTPSAVVQAAIDALLLVVAKSADDLRMFHDAVTRARIAPLPPLPRATVVMTERIIDSLRNTEVQLREVLTALGLPESRP
jgi:hypothetical protein